jgi:hypothetical protein
MADAIPLLGGEVRKVKWRLTPEGYFKCTFRYRVKNETTGAWEWTDFPVGTDLKIEFPQADPTPDIEWPVTSITGQYARFIIAPADVDAVLAAGLDHGQLWFDDGTGFDLAASGAVVVKE